MMNVSVVMPTYNRLSRLKKVLMGLEAQTYPHEQFEVVIVSDGSTDGTENYLQDVQTSLNLKPIFQKNQGPAVARNNGFEQAEGEFVLFIDDDVIPTPSLIAEHMKIHQSYEGDVVALGPMLTPADFDMRPWVKYEQAMLMKQYDDMVTGAWEPTARQFYTGNTSLKRKYLLQAGGFDPNFRRAEDVELAYRLADMDLRFVFSLQAVGYHYAERSFGSWLAIPYAYGRNDVIFTKEKGQTWLLPKVMTEFQERNLLIRKMTHICLDRDHLSNVVRWVLTQGASITSILKLQKFTQQAYSGIFNLRYYQGVSDELGGRHLFFAGIDQTSK